jgi:hypothetical protein
MSNIEEIFKSSLENYESPYDPKSWESISTKLDKQTIKTKKWNSTKTLVVASIVLISSSLFFIDNKKEEKSQQKITSTKVKTNIVIPTEKQKNIELPTKNIKSIAKTTTKSISITQPLLNEQKTLSSEHSTESKSINHLDHNSKSNKTIITFSVTSKEMYCLGETELLINENNYPIYLINEHNKIVRFEANEKQKITFNHLGRYYWSRENHLNTKEKMDAFIVKETTFINFNLPNNLDFGDGLPMFTTSTNTNQSIKWFINNRYTSDEKEINTPLFNKGSYEISLQSINENGCKSETSKIFNVEQNYNLLSVTGFEPSHNDPKRNVFMPFALKTRNTPFRMIIIDPNTNQVIFETNDIDKPWDGTNQITNQLVPVNSQFIWKVTLLSPVKNEKNEYRGIITRI